jgi:hypothetical protein
MAKYKNCEIPVVVVSHWMSTVFAINFMGLWEKMSNCFRTLIVALNKEKKA